MSYILSTYTCMCLLITRLALGKVDYYEHFGTHIDAPIHFGGGRQTLEEIPPERLIGPGVVIDVKEQAKANPNYGVTVADIKRMLILVRELPVFDIFN